jgi:hypothetical protein
MKKLFAIALFTVLVLSFLSTACTRKPSAAGPTDVSPTMTPTQTGTPDINFTVYSYNNATPIVGLNIQMSNGVVNSLVQPTGVEGSTVFKLNVKGNWTILIPAQSGFLNQSYIINSVDAVSNSSFAFDIGHQTMDIVPSAGETVGMGATTLTYLLTYHTGASKAYDLTFLNIPSGVTATANPSQVSLDGQTSTLVLAFPKSFENYTTTNTTFTWTVQGKDTTPLHVPLTANNNRTVTKGWGYKVFADIVLQKMGEEDPYGSNQHVVYQIGTRNYTFQAESAAAVAGNGTTGTLVYLPVGATVYGDVRDYLQTPTFSSPGNFGHSTGGGDFTNTAKIVSDDWTGSEIKNWVYGHNGCDGNITIHIMDDNGSGYGNLDIYRTFATTGSDQGWGEACSQLTQNCFFVGVGQITSCGNYPNTTGCSYHSHYGHREKAQNVLGTK